MQCRGVSVGAAKAHLEVACSKEAIPEARRLEGAALDGVGPLDALDEIELVTGHLEDLEQAGAPGLRAHRYELGAARHPLGVEQRVVHGLLHVTHYYWLRQLLHCSLAIAFHAL